MRLHPVLGQVQLEPQVTAVRAGSRAADAGAQLLDAGRRHGGQRVRQPVPVGRPGRADLPVRVQHPGVPDRREHYRRRPLPAEQGGGRVGRRHAREYPGQELPGPERGHVGDARDLLVGGPVHVVEHRPGDPPLGRPPQVADAVAGLEPPLRGSSVTGRSWTSLRISRTFMLATIRRAVRLAKVTRSQPPRRSPVPAPAPAPAQAPAPAGHRRAPQPGTRTGGASGRSGGAGHRLMTSIAVVTGDPKPGLAHPRGRAGRRRGQGPGRRPARSSTWPATRPACSTGPTRS